jgi:hypothetical protein
VEAVTPTTGATASSHVTDKAMTKTKWDDKLSTLRAARRAKGLCMKCGEQYSPQHRCPKQIPLHVLEEVLDLFYLDLNGDTTSERSSQGSEKEILSLSYYAAMGIQGKKTMRLRVTVHQHDILILIDSGSSGTFINIKVVKQLGLATTTTHLIQDTIIQELQWWTQGHCFTSKAKVLELGYYEIYDMILGMDWLEQFNPMWVHW